MTIFTVTNLNDSGAGSLRDAIAQANGIAGADTILFAAGLTGGTITLTTGALTISSLVTIEGDIDANGTSDIKVSGNHASTVFVVSSSGGATLDGLVIADGDAHAFVGAGINNAGSIALTNTTLSGNSAIGGAGGGIYNDVNASALLTNVTLSGNTAGTGAGIYNAGSNLTLNNVTLSGNTADFDGGGIRNDGTATLTNVTLSGNTAAAGFGGGLYNNDGGTVTVTNITVSGNSAVTGGGIHNENTGSATVTNSILLGNHATSSGNEASGSYNFLGEDIFNNVNGTVADVFAAVDPTTGGGLLADNGGRVRTIALKAVALNNAIDGGDDTYAPPTDSRGFARADAPGVQHNSISVNNSDLGAYEVTSFEAASLVVTTLGDVIDPFDNLTSLREALAYAESHAGADTITFAAGLAGGTITLSGRDLQISTAVTIKGDIDGNGTPDITISGNHASRVFEVFNTGDLTADGLVIANGSVSGGAGGGIRNNGGRVTLTHATLSGNNAAFGGGIENDNGTVTLTGVTLSANGGSGHGGGIDNESGVLNLTNVTLAGNGANLPGGGIYNGVGGTAMLTNVTLSGNSSLDNGGGILNLDVMTLTNSIVAGNTAGGTGADIEQGGTLTLTGGNIVGNTFSIDGVTQQTGITTADIFAATSGPIHAGVLADNRGPVQTIALNAASTNPALDASDTSAPATDARGVFRTDLAGVPDTDGGIADLGAFEVQANIAPVNSVPGTQEIEANVATAIAGLSIADADAASGSMTTTLSVLHGTLTVASAGGATAVGSGTASVTLTGTLAQIDTTLAAANNVVYTGTHDFFGTDTLTVTTNDNGNTGSGGAQSDTDLVTLHLNTPPINQNDFNGDAHSDLLWQTDGGSLAIWKLDGFQISAADYARLGSSAVGLPGPDWHIVDTGDFDGDGKTDILWRTDGGATAIWEMDGTHIKAADFARLGSTAVGAPGPDWHPLGSADFDGDGKADILWRTDSGALAIWEMDGTHIKAADFIRSGSTAVGVPAPDWKIVGVGDFDGDGNNDLLWETSGGALAVWQMNGAQIKSADYVKAGPTNTGIPGADWHVADVGDFDGDGKADILWRIGAPSADDGGRGGLPPGGGQVAIWEMNGNQIKAADYTRLGSTAVGAPGPDWHLLGSGDYNGDGMNDILWQTDAGQIAIWDMNGTHILAADCTKIGSTNVGAPGADWHLFQHHYDIL